MRGCNKVTYDTEAQALARLDHIKRTSKSVFVPKRAYECIKCDGWHLTSMDRVIYVTSVKNQLKQREKFHEDRFIVKEAAYWSGRLGIKETDSNFQKFRKHKQSPSKRPDH